MRRTNSPLTRRDLITLAGGVATAGALMGASGCGLLGGAEQQQSGNGKVEKAKLRVGALPTAELAPLYLAVEAGHFQREGLEVEIVTASDGGAALNSTIGGDYDITFSSYVPIFAAQAKGVANLKIVADCMSAVPNSCLIMSSPDSGVRTPEDLAGKRIAISGPGTISELMVKAAMKANKVPYERAQMVPLGFINMPNALKSGQVDAAFVVEPFLTLAARDAGAVPVLDTATGPLEDLPLGGYVSNAQFAEDNPKTVAAFQRAMTSAVAESQDRAKIEPLLPKFAKIDRETASIITLLKLNAQADATRLQRIPRLMLEFGYITKDVDVASMIVQPPQS
ncbi:transporter substrate-binding domain-containing protein [Saccharopolyspora rhizosphaerae]|uniref:Transporter substrate-binding domain-containing protein n=1 Tax=Saccharopolyspora rhizosphaerae TaxID=2492662 RepID=A0A3R8P6F3_9PSEU|nr:ABC transporter substrate-binding protein [Saccharopolyspora rhizosphaerae]RRO17344.1 transporter substrate-binding domain-containing protein [Saccharopolyspora rhizosphaerae]